MKICKDAATLKCFRVDKTKNWCRKPTRSGRLNRSFTDETVFVALCLLLYRQLFCTF